MHVANGVILCTPAAINVPVFGALSFSAAGPAAGMALVRSENIGDIMEGWRFPGTTASGVMCNFGFVPAGGIYATFQSAAMGSYGASVAASAAQAGAVAFLCGGVGLRKSRLR